MPKLIFDEFTSMPISPQLRYQRRKKASGKCRLCGMPAPSTSQLCANHRKQASDAAKGRIAFVPKSARAYLDEEPPPTQEEII